ncbi:hypothetical protein HII36_54845 [Nonomuraea sp. NN258]|uniref:ERF family protein n=1 Tax=Nonomuraea antri TaxID=2730852 RepID=UPI001568CEFA|nr:ERF family protein [Nonomuraea antri]NRQ40827.1 hypothetical protein [Nonomuraea antri]
MSLASKAAAKAAEANGQPGEETTPPATDGWGLPEREPEGPSPEVLAYEAATSDDDPEQVPVIVAWNRVMKDVRAIAKASQVESGPAKFWYRGVDAAMEAFAPVIRRHGVLVIPHKVVAEHAPATTSGGKPARETTVTIQYRIYGPMGDYIEGEAAGESLDNGDKGAAKSQSVALRTFLFHAGMVPLRDTDPDAHNLERGEAAPRKATDYRDEALEPRTSKSRLRQMHHELKSMNRLAELVENEIGDSESIGDLIVRIGHTRQ